MGCEKKSQAGLQATQVTAGATSLAPWRRAFAVLENFDTSEVWSAFFFCIVRRKGRKEESRKRGKDMEFIRGRLWKPVVVCAD